SFDGGDDDRQMVRLAPCHDRIDCNLFYGGDTITRFHRGHDVGWRTARALEHTCHSIRSGWHQRKPVSPLVLQELAVHLLPRLQSIRAFEDQPIPDVLMQD